MSRHSKQKQIADELFGTLSSVETKNPAHSFWEGHGHFKPTNTAVTYFIKAGSAGPSESHRALYRDLEKRWDELFPSLVPILEREYATQLEGADVPICQPRFSLDIVHLPELVSEYMEWALDFSCDQWEDALFTVHMKGWQPTGEIAVTD